MRRKSLRIFLFTLALALLLVSSSTAYADAVSISTVSLSNLQIVPTVGTIQFGLPGSTAIARATNSFGDVDEMPAPDQTTPQANASVNLASASASTNAQTFAGSAHSEVTASGCTCSAFSAGIAGMSANFIIMGGQGNVDVNITGLLLSMQKVMTDQFGLAAESNVLFTLDIGDMPIFSLDSHVAISQPGISFTQETMRDLSRTITLQFNTTYKVLITMSANSSGDNQLPEVPEPTTVVLLISGLGFMGTMTKRRRKSISEQR